MMYEVVNYLRVMYVCIAYLLMMTILVKTQALIVILEVALTVSYQPLTRLFLILF